MLFVASCKGSFFPIYRLLRVNSKPPPLITHILIYGVMGPPVGILCTFVVLSLREYVCYYTGVVFCVSPVSLCLGWWKSVRRATQRKGFTWVKLCWRMASSTMVSSHYFLLPLLPLGPALSSFPVPYLKPNLSQSNLLCAARCIACNCLPLPNLTSGHVQWMFLIQRAEFHNTATPWLELTM